VILVAVGATLTALATGLGALPFLAVRSFSTAWLGVANALAAGVMLGASIGLLAEGYSWNPVTVFVGGAAGALFVLAVRRSLPSGDGMTFQGLHAEGARKAFLIIVVMTAHSAAEGIGVGVAYGGGEALGVATTVAIALHNIPEGLAISLVLVPRGVSVGRAAAWSIASSLPQPLLAVPAFLLVDSLTPLLPIGLGFAAGAMVWMALVELVPEARQYLRPANIALILLVSCGAMVLFQSLVIGL